MLIQPWSLTGPPASRSVRPASEEGVNCLRAYPGAVDIFSTAFSTLTMHDVFQAMLSLLEWETGVYIKSKKVPVVSYKQGYDILRGGEMEREDSLSRNSMKALQISQWVNIM